MFLHFAFLKFWGIREVLGLLSQNCCFVNVNAAQVTVVINTHTCGKGRLGKLDNNGTYGDRCCVCNLCYTGSHKILSSQSEMWWPYWLPWQ